MIQRLIWRTFSVCWSVSLAMFWPITGKAQTNSFQKLTDKEIYRLIELNSPLTGAKVPDNMNFRLGAAHVAGKYSLTGSPYLIEGCKAIENLGFKTVKLWFQQNPAADYPYHSNWNLSERASLVDMAMHPYFKTVFDMPFKTFALSVRAEVDLRQAMEQNETSYLAEENAMYKLAKYLLETYRNRDIEFIFQNWEGDWLMRGGTGTDAQWTAAAYPANVDKRIKVMINWFKARQAGVDRARKEAGNTKCKIYHAIEVNKVLDCMNGVPGLALNVLPKVKVDMVSWSCYDGLENPADLWRGINFIKENMKPTGEFPGNPIMIGEIGIPENSGSVFGIPAKEGRIVKEQLIKRWDNAMAIFIAQNIPYIIQWEIYCNELKDGPKDQSLPKADLMRGFWLIRPDGTESYAASYLKSIIQIPEKGINK